MLHRHAAIQSAQAVGVPDARFGEEVCACIQVRAGLKAPTLDEIRTFCKVCSMFSNLNFINFINVFLDI